MNFLKGVLGFIVAVLVFSSGMVLGYQFGEMVERDNVVWGLMSQSQGDDNNSQDGMFKAR